MSESIQKKLPILEIGDYYLITKRGDISVVFELRKSELFSLSAWEIANLHQAWVKAISLLPFGAIVHLMDWYTQYSFRPFGPRKDPSGLARRNDSHFYDRPYFEHRCYCAITFRLGSRQPITSARSSLLKRSLVPDVLLNAVKIQDMVHLCRRFFHLLT